MIQVTQQLDLSQCAFGIYHIFKGIGDLLDCNLLIGLQVASRAVTQEQSFQCFLKGWYIADNSFDCTHHTTPYAPFPMGFMGKYLAGHSNKLPQTYNVTRSWVLQPAASVRKQIPRDVNPDSYQELIVFSIISISFEGELYTFPIVAIVLGVPVLHLCISCQLVRKKRILVFQLANKAFILGHYNTFSTLQMDTD